MAKIVVAGGAGFIGSHLCKALLDSGNQVLCIDNLCTGSSGNIKGLVGKPGFTFTEADVTNPLPKQVHQFAPNVVYNLASPASPVDYQNIPIETLKVGSFGTLNLLELARENKALFVQASTSEVYGDPLMHPQKEDYFGNVNPVGPRSCYDEAKRFGEAVCAAFWRKYGQDVRIIRIFNTYGPAMRLNDGRVVPQLIPQALKGEDMTVYGDGSQTRSFCFVSDLVAGLVAAGAKEGISGQVINLGNPDEYTILDFAKKIQEMTHSSSKIVFKPMPQDDPHKRKPDITKAKKLLGWSPKVGLDDGLRQTIAFFKSAS